MTEDTLRQIAAMQGWTAEPWALYDEESVESWRWTDADGDNEVFTVGDHGEPPEVSEELRQAVLGNLWAWRVTVWHANIKPEDRNSRTLSDGAQFLDLENAKRYARRVTAKGGKVFTFDVIHPASFGFLSLEQFDAIGTWTADQLAAWRDGFRLPAKA